MHCIQPLLHSLACITCSPTPPHPAFSPDPFLPLVITCRHINIIHDFTAVTFSVKLAHLLEKAPEIVKNGFGPGENWNLEGSWKFVNVYVKCIGSIGFLYVAAVLLLLLTKRMGTQNLASSVKNLLFGPRMGPQLLKRCSLTSCFPFLVIRFFTP